MQDSAATLTQLGYVPNETLIQQFNRIKNNTKDYDKIEKHLIDLHDSLIALDSYIAMSNSKDYLKIKIEQPSDALRQEALDKIERFSKKFKIKLEKVDNKDTFYILGFDKEA